MGFLFSMNASQRTLREDLRALPRGAWVLFFGTFLNKFGTFVLPFLAIYMTRLGFSVAAAGLATAAYGVGSLCASVLGRSEEHTSELQSRFGISYAVFCLK